jgi:hypothetical protein
MAASATDGKRSASATLWKWMQSDGKVWAATVLLCVLIRAFGWLVTDMPEAQGGDED